METDVDLCPDEEAPEQSEAIRLAAAQAMDAALAAWFVRWDFYDAKVYETLFGPDWVTAWRKNPLLPQLYTHCPEALQDHYQQYADGPDRV